MAKHRIERADIMPMEAFGKVRAARRKEITALKRDRRVACGPDATFYFECYDTMWMQIHEMLYIERGGEEQSGDELTAYNPLVPNGHELVATLMIEIEDADRRARVLAGLGGIEETVELRIGGETVRAVYETDVDRTTAEGKASAIHFLHFPLTETQIAAFRRSEAEVVLAITHPAYGHMARIPQSVREALSTDFDA